MRNRLHSLCPYFAMFPERFARRHIKKFTKVGDYVLDPFSGRGTTVLEALLMDRKAAAVDINPVAYCVSAAKAKAPSLPEVLSELQKLESKYRLCSKSRLDKERHLLPEFFPRAFHFETLKQIIFLRNKLKWRRKSVDRFIAALALGSLHGEMDRSSSYFSNQMPRTISTKPDYSLKYWRKKQLWPKKRDVFEILRSRAHLRLGGKVPAFRGQVALSDARKAAAIFPSLRRKVAAVITSPPYLDVTNYEEDQWLRLWFLGYEPNPTYGKISSDDRHVAQKNYWSFLASVWRGIAPLIRPNAKLICRIGTKRIKKSEITSGLKKSVIEVFPGASLIRKPATSVLKKRQTEAFRPGSTGCLFEIDYVFNLKKTKKSA